MARILEMVLAIFALLYGVALVLYLIGIFGLFGSPSGPLAAVFLLPLGLPWIWLIDSLPEALRSWALAAVPDLNLVIIWLLYRWSPNSSKIV